jgi:hypothetical protein
MPQYAVDASSLQLSASATSEVTGLRLTMIISNDTIISGGPIVVTVDEENTLSSFNNLTCASDWPFPHGEPFPSSLLGSPLSLAIYKGYYTLDNVSSGDALDVLPGQTMTVVISIRYLVFQPDSDAASAIAYERSETSNQWEPIFLWSQGITGTSWFSGTYPDANYGEGPIGAFSPGTYTIAAGDEWGQAILLHFIVVPAPASNRLVQALTSPYTMVPAIAVAACAGLSYFLLRRRTFKRRQSADPKENANTSRCTWLCRWDQAPTHPEWVQSVRDAFAHGPCNRHE